MVRLFSLILAICVVRLDAVRITRAKALGSSPSRRGPRTLPHEGSGAPSPKQKNHTFGDCQCAFTSGNKNSCCSDGPGNGMATGHFCGSDLSKATCGSDAPVCCTSRAAGSVCCPEGSACAGACGGGGGSRNDNGRCRCVTPPTNNTDAVAAFRMPLAKMFAHLAQAGYCGPDNFSPNWQNLATWECPDCEQAGLKLEQGSVRRITRQDGQLINATFAYVGRFEIVLNGNNQGPHAPRNGDCVIGFAGSIDRQNWKRNLEFNKNRVEKVLSSMTGLDKRFKFHRGFMKHWNALSANETEGGVLKHLKELGCGPGSGRRVFPTGQSLGAAAATISMAELKTLGYDVGLTYVFNSPRVGNKHTMMWYRTAFGRSISLFRMTHQKDPVPRLTPSALKYHSIGSEFYFAPNWDDKHKSEFVICQQEEHKLCSKRYEVIQTISGGEDHCENPLVSNGNICALPAFCDASDLPPRTEKEAVGSIGSNVVGSYGAR